MFSYIWPIGLIVLSNVLYQICAKSVPNRMDPFASLTITYLMAAVMSIVLYFSFGGRNLIKAYSRLNWAPIVLGIVIVGLEVGSIFAYKAGWQISKASIVQSAFLAVALIVVGWLLYRETLSWNKLLGVAICIVGLVVINWKPA